MATGIPPRFLLDPDLPPGFFELMVAEFNSMNEG